MHPLSSACGSEPRLGCLSTVEGDHTGTGSGAHLFACALYFLYTCLADERLYLLVYAPVGRSFFCARGQSLSRLPPCVYCGVVCSIVGVFVRVFESLCAVCVCVLQCFGV